MEWTILILAMLQVTLIDLVLGLDNAIVIALAAKDLNKKDKNRAIFFGMFLAIIIRAIFCGVFIILGEKEIILFYLIGGALLIYLGWKLMSGYMKEKKISANKTLLGAIMTIVVADAIMSIDNALAISQIANNASDIFRIEMIIVLFGLLLSIPIILFGAKFIMKLIKKWSWIIYFGGFLIIHIGIEMILSENFIYIRYPIAERTIIVILLALMVVGLKLFLLKRKRKEESDE